MNITANEVLLLDKKYNNMKLGMNDANAPQGPQAPVTEPSKPETVMNAMALQGQNNMAFQGAVAKIRKYAKIPVAAAMLAMAAPMMTSCVKQEQYTYVDMSAQMEALLATLENMNTRDLQEQQLALLNEMMEFLREWRTEQHSDTQATHERMDAIIALIQGLSGNLGSMSAELSAYFTQLFQHLDNFKTDVLAGLNVVINNQNLDRQQDDQYMQQVLALLLSIDTDNAANRTLLTQILAKLGDLESGQTTQGILLQQILPILLSIESEEQNQTTYLSNISDKTDSLNINFQLLYTNSMVKLNQIIANQEINNDQQDTLISIGLQILAKIPTNGSSGGSAIDYTNLLNSIFGELQGLRADLAAYIAQSLNNQNTLNANMLAGFQQLMANDDENTAAIIAAMDATRAEVALGFVGLGNKIDGLTNSFNTNIATVIANQGTQINNQAGIQAAIEALEPAIQNVSLAVTQHAYNDSALRAELNTLFGLQLTEAQLANATLAQILAAIPEGCHCQTLDLTAVINILNQILNNMTNGSGSNEGDDTISGGELD